MQGTCHFKEHWLAVGLDERIADIGNYPFGSKVATRMSGPETSFGKTILRISSKP